MKICTNINEIPKTEWQKLFELIPSIEKAVSFGTMKIVKTPPDSFYIYMSTTKLVDKFSID